MGALNCRVAAIDLQQRSKQAARELPPTLQGYARDPWDGAEGILPI